MNRHRCALFLLILALPALLYSCSAAKKTAKKQHSYMESAYATLKDAVNEAEVTILNDTIKVLFPEHLLFKKSSAEINEATTPLMQRFGKALNQYDKTSILVNGYTDNTGTDGINETLSKQRADSAKNMLERFDVLKSRIFTWGMGKTNPIGDNNTEEGRRRNRRVEFIILYNYEPPK
ncbi:OmpA family protein [Taibaiella koreensis]|uniref:OmpA family protein n=1 Tax=Taibaiella koreensis TaxID=1268548 RepID=UPI000E59AD39|nr:OmpA family protein [Taibaiella koreensis]